MSQLDIQRFNTNEVMSSVVVFNKVVYLSGQVPKNTDNDVADLRLLNVVLTAIYAQSRKYIRK